MDDLGLIEFLPNVHELFKIYNEKYFDNRLIDVKLEWSDRMTRCAGICMLKPDRRVIIRLSRPLLQLRPFSDTIDTLIHEMIHAYFFVIQGGSLDRDGHGADFCFFMDRINSKEGTHITIYHSFHDEVDHYKNHIWRCNGPCHTRPPFFGWVKRAMNRKPQPADSWWKAHQASCSGSFIKISGPEMSKDKDKDKITDKLEGCSSSKSEGCSSFKGKGRTWSEGETIKITSFFKKVKETPLKCVNCTMYCTDSLEELNVHLDSCLQRKFIDLVEDDD